MLFAAWLHRPRRVKACRSARHVRKRGIQQRGVRPSLQHRCRQSGSSDAEAPPEGLLVQRVLINEHRMREILLGFLFHGIPHKK